MPKSKVSQKRFPLKVLGISLVFVFFVSTMMFNLGIVSADTTTANHALRIVQQYKGVFTAPPTAITNGWTPDAPLLGNGDVGVAVINNINTMTFVLGKNEFWSLHDNAVVTMAKMSLGISSMSGASYSMTQDLATAEVNGTFTLSGNTITAKSWVQADDTSNNRFMTKFTYNGSGTKTVTVSFSPGNGNGGYGSSMGSSGDVLYIDVRADSADTVSGYNTHRARIAARVIGTTGSISNNQLNFTMSPGGTYTLITSIMSNYDNSSYQSVAISNINSKTQSDVDNYLNAHHTWWNNFYSKSFVEIQNKTVEKEYYGSLYLLASCSRTGEMAPGLFANWSIYNPPWSGDYTLNYNYEAPFYMTFPTNHTELADCYDKPVIDWIPYAQTLATQNGYTGAYYCVHIQPLPGYQGGGLMNQKSAGAFAATDMIMRYYYTRDLTYANSIYNTLKQIATFWQNYLSWDGSRYVIYNDAQHEGDAYPQTNGVMSLGLVRFLLQGVIDISTDLNVDSSLRATWQDRLSKISAFPTFTRNSQTVFRYTEVGRDWNDGNAIGNQHIYPASQIGLGSDANTLQIAKNTIAQMGRWSDDNGTNTFYPAAARVGHDPNAILNNLTNWINGHSFPNLHIHTGGGGIENLNTTPATICEMLMQSFQNKIRLFANWPSGTNAKFGDLLAYGNFLVSSDIRSNVVQYIRIISNKGRSCTFINPWSGQSLRIYRNGSDAGTLSGSEITIATSAGETIHIAPDGTSYSTILSMMDLSLSGAPSAIPGTVEAENYSAMSGIQTENCSEGTLDVGWTDTGDWLDYNVNVASAGTYVVNARVASPNSNTSFTIQKNGTTLATIAVPNTGGWQNWTTVTTNITLSAGVQTLRTYCTAGGFNINYINYATGAATPTPTPTPTLTPTSTPGGTPLDRTGWVGSGTGSGYSNAFDGNASTRLSTDAFQVNGQYFQIDMQSAKTFNMIRLDTTGSPNDYPRGYQVFVSNDGSNWGSAIASGTGSSAITDITFSSQTVRYLKIIQTGSSSSNYWSIHEFNLYTSGGSSNVVNLASNFNNDGFSYTSNPTDGNFDGGGWNYSANIVNSTQTYNGVPFQLGSFTDGQKNVVNATGQTITLPQGVYSKIWFLGSGTNGNQTGTFQINYTDGSNSQTSITETDWCNSASASNASQTMSYREGSSGQNNTTNYIDAFSLTTTSGKTVSSLTLPNNSNMHILAITLVQ